ncbi:MAG: hypothetical protein PHI68_06120 [Candidatus Cloacimonetes bacterium]|nr:hypothetical protein [Candidatus Cloacimonadota bacterium]
MKKILIVICILLSMSLLSGQSRGITLLKSLAVPGWGQISTGRNYGYGMLAAELSIISSMLYFDQEQDLKRKEAYQLALEYAHIQPGSYSQQYFRDLSAYNTSGYDAGGYNEMVRSTAMTLYPSNPQAQQEYIDTHIYSAEFAWNWDSDYQRGKFTSLRTRVNELMDYAKIATGVLLFNHLISGVDALRFSAQGRKAHTYMSIKDNSPILNLELEF